VPLAFPCTTAKEDITCCLESAALVSCPIVEGDPIGICGIVTLPAFFKDLLCLCKDLLCAPTGDQSPEAKSPLLLTSSKSTHVVEGISLQVDESVTTLVSVRS
jgi:hypothetical protein